MKVALLGASGFFAAVLAQAAPTIPVPGVPNIDLSSLTATSLLGLYALYVTIKTIPTLNENHRKDLASLSEAHRVDMDKCWGRLDLLLTKVVEHNAIVAEAVRQRLKDGKDDS